MIETPLPIIVRVIRNEHTVRIDFLPYLPIKKYANIKGAKFIKPIIG